jgi:hypothetical protein
MSTSNDINGTYLLIALLVVHITAVLVITPLVVSVNKISFAVPSSPWMNLMIQAMYAITTYHLYNIGYIFIAGMASVTLTMSFLITVGQYFLFDDEEDEDEEEDE